MVQEQTQVPALKLPAPDDKSAAAELLRSVIADPARVARTVAATTERADRLVVARAWAAGLPGNGFATAFAGMTSAEWREISRALLGVEDVAPIPSGQQARQP
jgi:hypothetical protein